MVQGLLDALLPPRCVGCGARGVWLCAECRGAIEQGALRRCCPHGVAVTYCGRCFPEWTDLHGVRVVGTLKFTGKRQSAMALGQLLARQWAHDPSIPIDAIVAVPSSAEGQRKRGYNQAELLARACAGALGLPMWNHVLGRTRVAPPQLGKTAMERRTNVLGLFAVAPRMVPKIAGRRIAVVDDVMTTGATLNAAASALRAAGSAEVWGVVLARPHAKA
jgi:ComF family protein